MKQPFMPLFFGDFLASTSEWSGEERALYLLLLAHQWSLGSLPNDIRRLAKLADYERRVFEQHWPMVSKKFVEREDRLYNLRLEHHRERSIELGNKRSSAGKTGAAKRWQPDSNGIADANGKQDGKRIASAKDLLCHPSHPIPSQSKNSPENSPPVRVLSPDLARDSHTPSPKPGQGEALYRDSAGVHVGTARSAPLTRAHAFDDVELMDAFAVVRSSYPKFAGRQDWPNAEHHWRMRVEDGATPQELLAGVERYAAFVAAGGASGSAFVITPGKFFGGADKPWSQPWTPPASSKPVPRIRTATDIAEEYEARAAAGGSQ